MKKLVVSAIAGVAMLSGAAVAQELPKLVEFGVSADTFYNVDTEEAKSDLGVSASAFNATLAIEPTINISEMELEDTTISLGYAVGLRGIEVEPYVSMDFDNDFNSGDTLIGVKSNMKF